MPDFAAAATRHYLDATYLHTDGRFANADHLAGIAAECGLKALILLFLGGSLAPTGRPVAGIAGNLTRLGHLPSLWSDVTVLAQGRTAARFMALISAANPFAHWLIDDRYEDGMSISPTAATSHLSAAQEIIGVLQRAQIDGALP